MRDFQITESGFVYCPTSECIVEPVRASIVHP